MIKIIELWMTLDDFEGANMNCNYKVMDGQYLVEKLPISAHSHFTFVGIVSYKITTLVDIFLSK